VETVIVREMLSELQVPVEEVVKGCFCCKFDELIEHMEKILIHKPDFLLGEPVGSCTDFVAAVANPVKIHYKDAFRFAPFSIMVDPDRVRGLLLKEHETGFPEEVAYLFSKQVEEADLVVLNKTDLISETERRRLIAALKKEFPGKTYLALSAKQETGLDKWLEILLSGKPGAETVLGQIDYDRYARAEAVLGWLNAAVSISAANPFDAKKFLMNLAVELRDAFSEQNAQIGHLKFVITGGGKSMWANLTRIESDPSLSSVSLGKIRKGTLLINARVRMEPSDLEASVRRVLKEVGKKMGISKRITDLQCFSPAYPEPPYLIRKNIRDRREGKVKG
ncbi:MAG: GTP-binding protein, partial [Thermodesulfobacteriota bacterium]